MIQPDLFDPPEPAKPTCGDCVVWNGYYGGKPDIGGCSIHGPRRSADEACDRWFATTQLIKALYGRE